MFHTESWAILQGSANPPLAAAVCAEVDREPIRSQIERFPDGEIGVEIAESVRGRHLFLLQPTSPPVDEHLIELVALADACRRAGAERITAVVPYFGYARADRRKNRRVPIMARMAAELLESAGVEQLVALDLHSAQVEGFFRIPVESLTAVPVLAEALRPQIPQDAVIVAPDLGATERASVLAERLGRSVAILAKRRLSGHEVEIRNVIGDVRDRHCFIVDDMISTGGTILQAAAALRQAGAREEIRVVATHALFPPTLPGRLRETGISKVVVTDSIANPAARAPGIETISIAPLLARAILNLATGRSLRDLF